MTRTMTKRRMTTKTRKRRTSNRIAGALITCVLLFVFAVAFTAETVCAEEPSLVDIEREIDQAAAAYLDEASYRLTFSQENYWALADSVFVTRAVLTARRPHAISIRYDDGGRIVASGGTLRVYIPQTNQFFVSQIDSTGLTIDPASILRSYTLHASEPIVSCSATRLAVRLVPDNRFMDPSRVDVTIDRIRHLVVRLAAYASSGDRSIYVIESTEIGPVIPNGEFQLAPPPGASVQSGSPYDHGDLGS